MSAADYIGTVEKVLRGDDGAWGQAGGEGGRRMTVSTHCGWLVDQPIQLHIMFF